MDKSINDFISSFKEIPQQIKPSVKNIFSSVATIVRFCIGFVGASIVFYIGILIGLIKAFIPNFFSIADELSGGMGLLHLISTIINWIVMAIPIAIAAFVAFIILGITGPTFVVRRAACILYATIVSAFFLLTTLFGGGSDEFGFSDACVITIVVWGTCVVVNETVNVDEKAGNGNKNS